MGKRKKADRPKTRHEKTPPWIVAADLYDGEWMSTSKLQIKAMTRPEINDLKTRVLGVLLIHSFGFDAEIGVVMRQLKRAESFEANPALVRKYPKQNDAVTEVMTSDSVATKLVEYALDGYEESGVTVSPARLKELREERQDVRKRLQDLEEEGRIERARLNCPARDLEGLGYEDAVKTGKLTPLRTMVNPDGTPSVERRKLGSRRGAVVGIFLLARPKPAATYGQKISVGKSAYSDSDNPNAANATSADQLCLDLGNEFGLDPKVLRSNPQFKRKLDQYGQMEQREKRDQVAKERLKLELRGIAELVKREQGSPTLTGKQKDLNFSKASALNSNGNHSKMSPTISSARVEGEGVAARAENTSASLNPNRKEESTTRTFPTTPTGRDAESSLVSQPRPRVSDPEAYQVLDALEKYCNATLEDAAMLIARCRQSRAVTMSQVVQAVELKGKAAKHKDSPIAYIMFWAPRLFQSTPERKPVESQSEPNMALIRSLYEKGTAEDRMTLLAEYPELAPATAAHGD